MPQDSWSDTLNVGDLYPRPKHPLAIGFPTVVTSSDLEVSNQFSDQCCEHLRAGQLLIRGSCVSVSDMRLI